MDHTQVLLKPLVSEKATTLRDSVNQVIFLISPKANKIDVRRAVEKIFKVSVTGVRVLTKQSVVRTRQGRTVGKTGGYKKAYVALAPGQKIELFEGV